MEWNASGSFLEHYSWTVDRKKELKHTLNMYHNPSLRFVQVHPGVSGSAAIIKSIGRLYKNDWRGVFGRRQPAKELL